MKRELIEAITNVDDHKWLTGVLPSPIANALNEPNDLVKGQKIGEYFVRLCEELRDLISSETFWLNEAKKKEDELNALRNKIYEMQTELETREGFSKRLYAKNEVIRRFQKQLTAQTELLNVKQQRIEVLQEANTQLRADLEKANRIGLGRMEKSEEHAVAYINWLVGILNAERDNRGQPPMPEDEYWRLFLCAKAEAKHFYETQRQVAIVAAVSETPYEPHAGHQTRLIMAASLLPWCLNTDSTLPPETFALRLADGLIARAETCRR